MNNYRENLYQFCIDELSNSLGENPSHYQKMAVKILCEQSTGTIIEYLNKYEDCIKCIDSLKELYMFENALSRDYDSSVENTAYHLYSLCDMQSFRYTDSGYLCDSTEIAAITGVALEACEQI